LRPLLIQSGLERKRLLEVGDRVGMLPIRWPNALSSLRRTAPCPLEAARSSLRGLCDHLLDLVAEVIPHLLLAERLVRTANCRCWCSPS
jgi:hypothetical protein